MDAASVQRKSTDPLAALPQGPGSALELAQDLAALGAGGRDAAGRWMSRPAVMRRIALLLAEGVPARATRVVVAGDGAEALGTGLSLAAGLPFAALSGDATGLTFGEVHAGEDASLVAVHHDSLAGLRAWCDAHGLTAVHHQSVFGGSDATGALFVVDAGGSIREGST
ncbi:hypothetical protein [Jiangella asiatica]|uniref:Uncharacterized protein n=1 Tax=Jiangella asiatica TaxID=2530372 RepID=A0A4R5DTB8_9ACTN|nr:hypothetical protein [Jiangella asiatica]TDE14375.1 hypothetical protein E1269_04260 [Jiangella asiatica]